MKASRPARAGLAGLAACAVLTGLIQTAAPALAADPAPTRSPVPSTGSAPTPPARVTDPGDRLGRGWNTSTDRAVTGAADTGGFSILVADSSKAYEWRTAAVLAEPGLPADSWIGNTCAIDHDHVAAVYAPRTFTNKPDLMQGGAFTAVVDLTTGRVTKLPFTATLAYFDPSCNTATHTAAFTAFRDMNDPANTRTRVITVDASGRTVATNALAGELTGAVPVKDGAVAARGRGLVHIDRSGKVRNLATAAGTPFDIRPTAGGQIAFVDRADDTTASVKLWRGHAAPTPVATGRLGDLDLQQGDQGRVFLTGHPTGTPRTEGTGITRVDAPADTDVSTLGRLAVRRVVTPGIRHGLARVGDAGKGFDKSDAGEGATASAPDTVEPDEPTTVASTATATGERITQTVTAATPTGGSGNGVFSPALTGPGTSAAAPRTATAGTVSHDPTDPDRWCSVPRNDVKSLALQPTANQVEWAVDMAVRGELHANWLTQGGWRDQSGLGTVDPQGLFPRPSLTGGGRIPANVLLGVMAQESNLWQAEPGSVPGQMGNPLASYNGFYGHKGVDGDPASFWTIHWDQSDCGYGVGQVTDGMRLAGHEKPGETALSPAKQRAVALDYAVNVAASMYILADKWNEVHDPGQTITVNNDDALRPENWFVALWNYNSGMNARSDADKNGNWGLGWFNNPANPTFKPDRKPFLDSKLDPDGWAKDPAHPQDWSYEEKVLGWAAWSMDTGYSYATSGRQDWPGETGYATAGFQPAWWTSDAARSELKPPLGTFCNAHNNCDAASPPDCPDAACYTRYWWHESNATWKNCAAPTTACGNESLKYVTLRAEPGRGTRLQNGTPVCSSGLPSNTLIVNSMPDNTNTYGDCGSSGTDAGSFQFSFYPDPKATGPALGQYEAKADLHQVGGGYNGHFWYTHTRDAGHLGGIEGPMTVSGTWTLEQSLTWARVMVHLPDTGAQTRLADYVIGGSDSTAKQRTVEQRANRWVSLGAFHFTGTPSVTLTNVTDDGTADEDVAWDAVAFQPLSARPDNMVVAMGDSYASGEGASDGNRDYYPETNYRNVTTDVRDACHRSRQAWSRQATLPGETQPTGSLDDSWSTRLDYHLIACSGARTYNMLGTTQGNAGEKPQLDQGYLDQNTTLVTLSVGGNDARFTGIVQSCLLSMGAGNCGDRIFTHDDTDAPVGGRDEKFVGQPLVTAVPGIINEIVRPDIVKTIMKIHAKAPSAKIVLMGYPPLFSDRGSCLRVSIGGTQLGLSGESADWLNGVAGTLATAMQGAVDDVNRQGVLAWFSNPAADFAGKAVCGNPEQVNGIVKTLTTSDIPKVDWSLLRDYGLSAQSFHPKTGGARLYADVLQRTMAGMGL